MKPRLLVLDDDEGRIAGAPAMARLRELAEVTVLDRPLDDGDLDRLAGVRVLLAIRERTRLDPALLERLPELELILQTGGHAYHVDQQAATGRGVVVALSRRARTASAAVPELTFGLMLAVLRRIHPLAAELAGGAWPAAVGGTLAGRTLGVLGLGRHGRPVARIAAAFGMLVLAWDRDPGREYPDDEWVHQRLPLDDLLARADVVSVHLKLSPESTGLLDRDRLARLRPGAILVNTARGAIVDEQALVEALTAGRLAGAGLDVFATEPLPADHPLRRAPNVVLTPHIGWKVDEVFAEWAEIAAEQLEAWLAGRLPADEVLDPAAAEVPRDRRGGLAPILPL
ncbi:MAG TPA: NAD(P)-dependent oxidoreductase [Actinomycetota bacterium]|jgi:phosphoglycerate dehydrogenase-like enzyme|nr:NAD(P)-dependent oxidoreductase [Actinomycetota bacterium]